MLILVAIMKAIIDRNVHIDCFLIKKYGLSEIEFASDNDDVEINNKAIINKRPVDKSSFFL